jgi:hypothetical protein
VPCLLPRAEVAIDMWDLDVEGVDSGHNEHHPTPYHTCYRRERVVVRCGARAWRVVHKLRTGSPVSPAAPTAPAPTGISYRS